MKRDKEIGVGFIGFLRTFLQSQIFILVARIYYLYVFQILFQELAELQRHPEVHILFLHAIVLRAGVFAAMTGVNHHHELLFALPGGHGAGHTGHYHHDCCYNAIK